MSLHYTLISTLISAGKLNGAAYIPVEAVCAPPLGCEVEFPEYQSPEDKRKEYQRDYYQRNKDKILAECAQRYAAKKEEKPEPPVKSEEEIAAEEAARKERRREYQREYQREWQKKRKAEQVEQTPQSATA